MQATQNTSGAAITGTAVTIAELANITGPAIVRGVVGGLTALAAAESVTLTLIRTDTSAVIATSIFTNSGAGASAGGPLIVEGYVPASSAYGVALQILGSVATGAWTATATNPVTLSQLP